ncbi:MAG TPA: hypothetical protein VIL27_00580 [Clostridia bacterium]
MLIFLPKNMSFWQTWHLDIFIPPLLQPDDLLKLQLPLDIACRVSAPAHKELAETIKRAQKILS